MEKNSDSVQKRLKQNQKKIKRHIEDLSPADKHKMRAIALKYDLGKKKAPKIIATGKGVVAEKILQVAQDNQIPFFEDKALTDLLAKLELDVEIPPELFTMVAEVLAVVYQMNKLAQKKKQVSKKN